MEEKNYIEIIEFTDPACTWCWGSEPILRKLETNYEGNIEINFIMGGLVKDIRTFRDDFNDIGGDISKVNSEVASHWLEASSRHGMPVEEKGFNLLSEETPSTYPMNMAYKAAQFQSEELSKKFLRKMRQATAAEARRTNQTEVLIELAQESGLDVAEFIKNFTDGSAEKAFYEDLKITRSYRANGFPSFLVKSSNGKEIMLRGYQSYDAFKQIINHLTGGELDEKKIKANEENIYGFISKYGTVAPVEIETTFNLTSAQAKKFLDKLQSQKKIDITPAGNGYFISLKANPLVCDSETGLCNI